MTTVKARRVGTRLGELAVHDHALDGGGDAPVAVLWHSMFVDSSSWDRMVDPLRRRRRLVVVDGPGFGDSAELTRVTTLRECAAAARDLLDGLGIHGAVDWVGNAFGGHVGYQLAADAPDRVRTLVAISAPLRPIDARLRLTLVLLRAMLATVGPTSLVVDRIVDAQLTDFSRAADPEAVAFVRDAMGRQTKRSLAAALGSFVLGRRDLTAEAERCAVPALLVASDDRGDWSPEDAHAAAARIPRAQSITVSWARTLIPIEQPIALSEAIIRFWAATGGAPAGGAATGAGSS